jgi:hypothetical protein
MLLRSSLLVLCCGLLACEATDTESLSDDTSADGDSSTSDPIDTTSTTSTHESESTGEPPAEICECVEMGGSECSGAVDLCEKAFLSCYGMCVDEETPDSEVEALDCVLTALRDRTPGRVTWLAGDPGGSYWKDVELAILPDGTAVRSGAMLDDLSYCPDIGTLHLELKAPAVFDECLTREDLDDRFRCLNQVSEVMIASCTEEVCELGED